MEGIGQVLARQTGSSDASEMPTRVSPSPLDTFSPLPTRELPTTAGTDAETSLVPELLLGLASASDAREAAPPGSRECSMPENAAREEEAPQQLPSPRASAHEQAPEPLRPELLRPKSSAPGLPVLEAALHECAAAADALRSMGADEARLFGFVAAADFAGRVEEISRSLEYLQVVAAQAVERTRKEAQQTSPGSSEFGAGPGWRTGWTEPEPGSEVAPGSEVGPVSDVGPGLDVAPVSVGEARSMSAGASVRRAGSVIGPGPVTEAGSVTGAGSGGRASDSVSPLDDGYRTAAEFLRARLRISIGEARRRLALAPDVLPQTGMAGQQIPARREVLADALSSALVPSRSATIISTALDTVRQFTDEDTITRMEHALTTTAMESDPDFVAKMTKRWTDVIDQDGAEPSEEVLRQLQGAFLRRRRRHGLHHLEIFATAEQYETLTTAMNTATNPRLTTGNNPTGKKPTGPDLDRRSRAQKLLNGLVGACALAMTTGKLPSNGGLRPQLTVTIDHRDLFEQLTHNSRPSDHGNTGAALNPLSTGTATFTGPIHPNTIRKIACDADIIPVLLGTDSRVLDIGRTTRIFPPHIRKAITARDRGCAFPDCTIPAPWCEAHHTTYWSHGGTTSTNNGTLLCSHHHHLIHKEQWRIDITTGVPWFIPPPHLDPQQTPRRNHHHTPQRT
ncbi:HNH endonuclease signature motif containing protein [Paenarthrobacter nitroguajacolicus]|uniref:HNH endonuclease signature motif containing protein n=1 Tax=Paenarthrobacter nitroguajacolicus TaxID=211146 RepID=UPI003D254024